MNMQRFQQQSLQCLITLSELIYFLDKPNRISFEKNKFASYLSLSLNLLTMSCLRQEQFLANV